MIKRFCLSMAMAVAAILLVVVPVLAAYYAYIYVEESDGNSYDQVPLSVDCNTTRLAQGDFISSTALDTRVLTGSSEQLPHMVADDKVMFVTDLEAYEDKTLIFYMGATSLSSFPIIVGYNGSFETPDDPDLELGYVMELLIDGYFDTSAGADKNILYKEDAFKVCINGANNLSVQCLNSTAIQWEMNWNNFTTGEHTVYIYCNGLAAYLYVDNFVTAKDTANLFDSVSYKYINTEQASTSRCFYEEGYYWIFYSYNTTHIGYVTSPDGITWSAETAIANYGSDEITMPRWGAAERDGYVHLTYYDETAGNDPMRYRRGQLNSTPAINWSDGWSTVVDTEPTFNDNLFITIDQDGYPYITCETVNNTGYLLKSGYNNGTWIAGYSFQIYYTGVHPTSVYAFNYYPNSNKLLMIYRSRSNTGIYTATYARYYNGASWEAEDIISAYVGDTDWVSMAADDNDNMYISWSSKLGVGGDKPDQYLSIRYDGEVWWGPLTLTLDGWRGPGVSYNENNGVVYILYPWIDGTDYVYCVTLNTVEMELNNPIIITTLLTGSGGISGIYGVNPYSDHIGWAMDNVGGAYHTSIDLTVYQWNDNANDWTWMQNNCMAYADDIQMAADGVLQLEYKPDSIIQGTTLPDEQNDNDATITWGTNPTGVSTEMSELQFDQSYNETYYYQYLSPGSTDIINPDPEAMTGDVDIIRLRGNPLYPFVQLLSIGGFLSERLAWLGLAWFIVILAMFGVHLGFDTRKDTEKPQHFVLTTITGMGLSILFFTMGIFPWWVMLLMAFGLIGAIIWERQPVI